MPPTKFKIDDRVVYSPAKIKFVQYHRDTIAPKTIGTVIGTNDSLPDYTKIILDTDPELPFWCQNLVFYTLTENLTLLIDPMHKSFWNAANAANRI